MTMHFFEGFETVGTSLGLANESTTGPRIALRWDASSRGGTPSTDSFFLIDDVQSEGYAIKMGTSGPSNSNYLRWHVPSGKQAVGASATEFIVGCRVHIPTPANTFAIMSVYNSQTIIGYLALRGTQIQNLKWQFDQRRLRSVR
jgi:hypothetical protein